MLRFEEASSMLGFRFHLRRQMISPYSISSSLDAATNFANIPTAGETMKFHDQRHIYLYMKIKIGLYAMYFSVFWSFWPLETIIFIHLFKNREIKTNSNMFLDSIKIIHESIFRNIGTDFETICGKAITFGVSCSD